jgi:hypothetical protein
MTYRADRGGHAPDYLRTVFQEYLEAGEETDTVEIEHTDERQPLRWLIGQLWDCTDVLPSAYCALLDLPQGNTYAQAVRQLRQEMG